MSAALPRAAWTRTTPAAPAELRRPLGLAVHWVGPPVPAAVNRGDRAAVARYLEGVRRLHVAAPRRWSDIAYQAAVDQAGRVWILRGWRLRSAANGDGAANAKWGAVLALVGQGQTPSPAMLRGLAQAREDFRHVHPTGVRLVTHNDVRPEPTACPGPHLTRFVKVNHGRPPAPPRPPVIPLNPLELLEMKLTDKITIPAEYASNQTGKKLPDGTRINKVDEVVTVEVAWRRIYDWTFRAMTGQG